MTPNRYACVHAYASFYAFQLHMHLTFSPNPPLPTTQPQSNLSAEEKAQELIERTVCVPISYALCIFLSFFAQEPPHTHASHRRLLLLSQTALLSKAKEALSEVREREPSDSRHRRTGTDITIGPTVKSSSSASSSSSRLEAQGNSYRPALTTLSFAWESDTDEDDDEDDVVAPSSGTSMPFGGGGGGGSGGSSSSTYTQNTGTDWGPGGLDTWFGGKVDTGSVALRPSAVTPTAKGAPGPSTSSAGSVAVLDRPNHPTSLEFAPPEAPSESGASTIFPESLALRFQSDVSAAAAAVPAAAAVVEAPSGTWDRTSGEEFGPNGYWYRWTEVQGRDATGAVQWSERWWEVSDWRGMKEMGAEKWGSNDNGDAWRESWRESIGFDESTGQPMVERSAHKWARAGTAREWEEKWGESYLSGGKADKWADKWGREGTDVWHEKWGEKYDGAGGCVKWTDRWAERPSQSVPGALEKWGDKWEEVFSDGRGSKKGETWSEQGPNERYNRWWGENHQGGGVVQKFGNSSTGEHWDVTEHMDTYYNPIPHFGYDLALAHSPQLRSVPMLPRDTVLEGEGKGKGKGKKRAKAKAKKGEDGGGGGGDDGGGGLGSIFG